MDSSKQKSPDRLFHYFDRLPEEIQRSVVSHYLHVDKKRLKNDHLTFYFMMQLKRAMRLILTSKQCANYVLAALNKEYKERDAWNSSIEGYDLLLAIKLNALHWIKKWTEQHPDKISTHYSIPDSQGYHSQATQGTPFMIACQENRPAVAALFKANIVASDKETLFLQLVENRLSIRFLPFLIDKKDINKKDALGITPLIYALRSGYKNAIRWLIEQGADPNLADEDGYKPLAHLDAQSTDMDAIKKLLITHGARLSEEESDDNDDHALQKWFKILSKTA